MIKQPKLQSAVIGLLAALCLVGIGVEANGAGKHPAPAAKSTVELTGASLVSYTNCLQMLQQVKAQALKEVGPYGLAAYHRWGALRRGLPRRRVRRRRFRPRPCGGQRGGPVDGRSRRACRSGGRYGQYAERCLEPRSGLFDDQ